MITRAYGDTSGIPANDFYLCSGSATSVDFGCPLVTTGNGSLARPAWPAVCPGPDRVPDHRREGGAHNEITRQLDLG